MYQLFLPGQVISIFVKQQGLPQQGQSTWKIDQGFSPTSHAEGNHRTASTGQHIALPILLPLDIKRAVAGLVSDLFC